MTLLLIAWSAHSQQTGLANTIQDFRSRVIDFREDGLRGCIRDGVLVNPSPADLEVGDVFIDVDGNAKIVARVERVGNDIYIDTVEPRFEDVFLYAEIPDQLITFNQDNLLPESFAGKGSITEGSPDPRGTWSVSLEKELYNKPAAVVKLSATAGLAANVSIGFRAPTVVTVKIRTWKFWKWKISFKYQRGYIRGGMNYDLDLTGAISFAFEGSKESEPVLLYGFGTPTSGVEAGLGLFSKFILEGAFELSLPLTFSVEGSAAARCTLDGQFPYMVPTDVSGSGDMDFSVTISPELTAEAVLKQKFYLGGDITVAGITVTEFEAGAGPYIKVSGTLGGSIGYSSTTGLIGPTWSAEATGEIGMFTDISGNVCDGQWSISILSMEFPIYTLSLSTEDRLADRLAPRRAPRLVCFGDG